MTGKKSTRKPRLRWWQRLGRLGVAAALVLAVAYAALPWWAPTGWLAERIARRLSEQADCDVRIGRLSLSWFTGIEVSDLTISDKGDGNEPLATVRTARADLAPLQILLYDDLGIVRLTEPTLHVVIDANGQTNLAPLARLRADAEPSRVLVERAKVHLRLSDEPNAVELQVSGMEVDCRRGGRVSLSGSLGQGGAAGSAPLSLSAQASPGGGATASLTFARLDLSALPIARLAKMPLRRLAGTAEAEFDLHVSRQGIVDNLDLRLRVRELDAQPSADVRLPVIDEALLDVSAAYDQITGALSVQTARLRLPGVADLTCEADAGSGVLAGQWEAIESLNVSGQVQPEKLAAMLTGRRELSGDLEVLGAVQVLVEARREEVGRQRKLRLRMSADATAARFRGGGRVLKPAGRLWDMGLTGALDYRTTGLDVGESWLKVASNRFTGYGVLVSLRKLAGRLADADGNEVGQALVSELARLDWQGQWKIDDLPALADLAAADAPADVLDSVRIDGPLTGRWFIHHGPLTHVHVTFQAAGDAGLRVGNVFRQPPGAEMDLSVELGIDPNDNRLTDMNTDLAVGQARLGLDRLRVSLPDGDSEALEIEGRFSAERIEDLLACLSGTDDLRRGLGGSAAGRLSVRAAGDLRRLNVEADLKDSRLSLGRWFRKQPGQPGRLSLEMLSDDGNAATTTGMSPTSAHGASLVGQWTSPQADVAFQCRYLPADANALIALPEDGKPIELTVDTRVNDASQLESCSPVLAEALAGRSLAGAMRLTADARYDGFDLAIRADCDATELSLATPPEAAVRRTKPAGTPLRVSLAAHATIPQDAFVLDIRRFHVDLAGNRLGLAGRGEWAAPPGQVPGATGVLGVPVKLAGSRAAPVRFDLDANASITFDDNLRALAPEAVPLIARLGLSGGCSVRLRGRGDPNGLRMAADVDATGLGARCPLPTPAPNSLPEKLSKWLVELGPIVKNPGSDTIVELDLSCPADFSMLRVHNLLARTCGVQLVAGGSLAPPDANASAKWPKVDLHASLAIPRAETLREIMPNVRDADLAGGVLVDMSVGDLATGRIDRVVVDLDKCRARVGGKEVFADGTCVLDGLDVGPLWPPDLALAEPLLEGAKVPGRLRDGMLMAASGPAPLVASLLVKPATMLAGPASRPNGGLRAVSPPGTFAIRRLRCEGIEFRAGASRGWLVADVSDIPAAAKGKIHLLASRLDVQELSAWTEDANAPRSDPNRPWRLTDPQLVRVLRDANALASALAKHTPKADLDVRISAEHFRTFDQSVQIPYELRHVEFEASVERGAFEATYTAGLNGGRIRDVARGDLTDPNAPVTCETTVEGVMAEANIQPQLAKFFPGNTILGTFNKTETTTAPLIDVLAANLDARWPITRTGDNKTVAVEGVTEGRAAPEFVTKIFPGLNLTKYRYRKMTAFADMRPDGTTYNDMVFDGKSYDLYMEGTTDANGIGRYEIGLILLGTPQSAEWNHKYRLGRIPLLNFRARIEGGKLYDQEVSYLWPNETLLTVFLKNNIFYRIWRAGGKNKP